MPVFDTPNSTQTFTVPDGVQELAVDLQGAGGGQGGDPGGLDSGPGSGASGGRLQGVLDVAPGDTITVELAAAGAAGTTPGGGSGGSSPYYAGGSGGLGSSGGGGGGGGAGATALYVNGDLVGVVGGGGGGGGGHGTESTEQGGGGGGGARGGAGGSDGGGGAATGSSGSGSGSDGGSGGQGAENQSTVGADGDPGDAVVVDSSRVSDVSTTLGGGNSDGARVELSQYQPSATVSYVADDELAVEISGGASFAHYEVELNRDGGGWVSPAGGPSSPSSTGTYSYGPHDSGASAKDYAGSVGVDSKYVFRVRGVTSDGSASAWTTTDAVFTSPVPPHDPSVSRPDGETIDFEWTVRSDIESSVDFHYRKDAGSGYGSWNVAGAPTGSNGGSATGYLTADNRYQYRLRTVGPDGKTSDWMYADYGNENSVYFKESYGSGDLSAWDTANGDVTASLAAEFSAGDNTQSPASGGYAVQYNTAQTDIKELGDLSAESDVQIRVVVQTASNDNPDEYGRVDWYDGNSWTELQSWGWEYDGQGWLTATIPVPDDLLATDNRLRVGHSTGAGYDWVAFDRVVVADVLDEYTTPAAPSNLSVSGTSNRHELSADWTTNATDFEPSFMEVRTRVAGSNDARDKLRVAYPDESTTYLVDDGYDETVPERDGEQYQVRIDALVQQYRRGSSSANWRAKSPQADAVTLLPAPTDHAYTNVTATGADHEWTPHHDYGSTKIQARHDGSGWEAVVTGLDRTQDSYEIASLLHGEEYDVRVVAETEHTQSEDQ